MAQAKATPARYAAEGVKWVEGAVQTGLGKVQDLKQMAGESLPGLSEGARKVLHAASYYAGYGTLSVYGGLSALISKKGPIASGFREGMAAAAKTAPVKAPSAARKARAAAKKAKPKK